MLDEYGMLGLWRYPDVLARALSIDLAPRLPPRPMSSESLPNSSDEKLRSSEPRSSKFISFPKSVLSLCELNASENESMLIRPIGPIGCIHGGGMLGIHGYGLGIPYGGIVGGKYGGAMGMGCLGGMGFWEGRCSTGVNDFEEDDEDEACRTIDCCVSLGL